MAETLGQPVAAPNYDRTGQPSDGFKVAIIVGLLLVVLSVPCVLVSVGIGGIVLLTYRSQPQPAVAPLPPMRADR